MRGEEKEDKAAISILFSLDWWGRTSRKYRGIPIVFLGAPKTV
jgi:hypothetical protein